MAATQRQCEFVLLYGGCYGAWAWFPVEAELRKAGSKVKAMDMAGAGVHLANPAQPALDFLESLPAKEKEIVVLASRLVRPYPNQTYATPITYTKERYGQVPSVYIKYPNDNAFTPEGQEYVASRYGPFREVIELEGGHFNFLQRPGEFTKLIVSLAQKHSVYSTAP